MKTIFRPEILLSVIMLVVFCALPANSQEKATKEECVAKVNEAIELIQKQGVERSLKTISDKTGPYNWKDSYVFCIDNKAGKMLAHPSARFLGFPMKNYKDADGKTPFIEIIEVANSKGNGWKGYKFVDRSQKKTLPKNVYFSKVPEKDIIVCAGYYE
jgi:cytochrome c